MDLPLSSTTRTAPSPKSGSYLLIAMPARNGGSPAPTAAHNVSQYRSGTQLLHHALVGELTLRYGALYVTRASPFRVGLQEETERLMDLAWPLVTGETVATSRSSRSVATGGHRLLSTNESEEHAAKFDLSSSGRHYRILGCESAQLLLVVGFDYC
jgi:hypothetical protein